MLKANVSFDIMSVVLPLIAIALIYPSGLDLETGALISKGSTRLQEIVDMCPSPSTLKNFETRCGHTDLLLIRDMVGANAVHVWADATKQNGTEYNVSVLCWFDNKRQDTDRFQRACVGFEPISDKTGRTLFSSLLRAVPANATLVGTTQDSTSSNLNPDLDPAADQQGCNVATLCARRMLELSKNLQEADEGAPDTDTPGATTYSVDQAMQQTFISTNCDLHTIPLAEKTVSSSAW